MATRTSSPTASRSKSTSAKGGSTSRSRSTGKKTSSRRKPAPRKSVAKRPAPRAVRNGTGPISRLFTALGGAVGAVWLGTAHVLGAGVRRVGRSAGELEPEHRRDGAGLFLLGVALVVAAAVWWQLPGGLGDLVRAVVAGSVGLMAWFVPLALVFVAWRNLRDPDRNGPAGRQVIGWVAFTFGVLVVVHIANGSPRPALGDTRPLQQAGGALGFVVSKLLMDLVQNAPVVVALLVLLAVAGLLVITATPVYQIPARLGALRDRMLGRTVPDETDAAPRLGS
ncbi:MAG: DNA translocase FtsK 4TM domain-containing protein, partial [Marmoricola sp.]